MKGQTCLVFMQLVLGLKRPLQKLIFYTIIYIFFLSGFSFTDTDDSQDSRGKEETLPLPPAHEHSDI